VFGALSKRLEPVVTLKTRDEAARRRARRKYVRIIMNDWLMNPGPSMAPISSPQETAEDSDVANGIRFERFGLMAAFVKRWAHRLPQALAHAAGEHVQIPPGNDELRAVLEAFEK
jgi:hypothetical protein